MPRFWAMIRGDQFRVTRETGEQDTGFYVCRITEAADEQAAITRLQDEFAQELKGLPLRQTPHSIIDIEEIETIPTGNDDFKETGFIFFNDQALPDQN
jgi:hypothetical protein